MTNWILTLGLQNLRAQINTWAPDRDHTSDGTIGDAAHQKETSGHNPDDTPGSKAEWNGDPDSTPEVRAFDCDVDFRNGASAQQLVDHIVGLKPSSVLRYVIYNRRIYEASNGWASRAYTGASPHTEHIHFSGAYTQASDNNTTYDYRLEEIPVAMTTADKIWVQQQNAALLASIKKMLETGTPLGDGTNTYPTGSSTLSQGVPPVPGAPRQPFYVAFAGLNKTVQDIAAKVGAAPSGTLTAMADLPSPLAVEAAQILEEQDRG